MPTQGDSSKLEGCLRGQWEYLHVAISIKALYPHPLDSWINGLQDYTTMQRDYVAFSNVFLQVFFLL